MTSSGDGGFSFSDRVRKVVQDIPSGQVLSYAEVAARSGFPCAARAVGTLMKKNYDPAVPCHRVICSDGRLGQYNRGVGVKERRLRQEGVLVEHGRVLS